MKIEFKADCYTDLSAVALAIEAIKKYYGYLDECDITTEETKDHLTTTIIKIRKEEV